MEKNFNQKNFNNFVWSPLGSRGNIYINFCLQVHFQVSAVFYCSHYLPTVSLIQMAICHRHRWHRRQICRGYHWHRWQICWHRWQICRRCRWYRWQFVTGVADNGGKFANVIVDTGGKFATGINNTTETGGKICRRCRWYRWQICDRCRWYRWQFCRRCRWHRWQICHPCRWHRWSTFSCEYLREFSKKFETALMVYSRA